MRVNEDVIDAISGIYYGRMNALGCELEKLEGVVGIIDGDVVTAKKDEIDRAMKELSSLFGEIGLYIHGSVVCGDEGEVNGRLEYELGCLGVMLTVVAGVIAKHADDVGSDEWRERSSGLVDRATEIGVWMADLYDLKQ